MLRITVNNYYKQILTCGFTLIVAKYVSMKFKQMKLRQFWGGGGTENSKLV